MMDEFDLTDKNGDGVPDAFENHRPISETLFGSPEPVSFNPEKAKGTIGLRVATVLPATFPPVLPSPDEAPLATLEIEVIQRPPRRGEMYFDGHDGLVKQETMDLGITRTIVKRIISAPSYWKIVKR